MKKPPFAILFALVFTLGVHADDSVDANGTISAGQAAPQPETQVQAGKPQSAADGKETAVSGNEDSIDLDEVDDSADADKRPTVKFVEKPVGDAEAAPVPDVGATKDDAAKQDQTAPVNEATEPVQTQTPDAAPAPSPSPAVPAPAQESAATPVANPLRASDRALVDISCDDATLADILRQFRKTTGANIISGDSTNLMRRVSVNLNHVPWLQALQSILNSRGFRLEPRDGIYFVSEDMHLDPLFTKAYTLNHASSEELANLFNSTYATKGAQGAPAQQIATAFPGANVVVVTAKEKILRDCEQIIQAVDRPAPQVYIEARFIELSNEAMRKLGMQWDSLSSWGATVKGLSGGWEYNNGRSANYGSKLSQASSSTSPSSSTSLDAEGKGTSNTSTSRSDSKTYTGLVPAAIAAADGASRTANSMAWRNARGFSGQLSVDDFRLAMSAFEQIGEGRVFSNPKIIVSNGKEAKVDMTTKYPNVTIDSNFTGQNQNSLSVSTKLDTIPGEDKQMFAKEAFFSWGIMLTVKPRISPDGLINVEIVPTISDCTGYATVQSNQESDTPYTKYPIIEVKRLTTDFTMSDGGTAVIGGLSKTVEEDVDSGIPLLRKIPWIGRRLFGWTSRQKVQKEIVVFVTVGIANPHALPADIGLPKNAIMGREYVDGIRLEPGDRPNAAASFLKIDERAIDDRKKEDAATLKAKEEKPEDRPGTVIIKMSNDDSVPTPRPEVSSNGDGSVTVRRVSAAEQDAPAAPEPAPAAPEPLVNKDTAKSVDDLLSE